MTSPKRILVVDDDHSIQDAFKDALEDEGYAVDVAGNGAEAFQKVRAGFEPSAILLDYMMPIMDGATFVAEAKKDPALSQVPIILITADGRAAEKAAAVGLSLFLRKPVKLEELLATIAAAS